jgi:hypothetical protein
VADAGVADDIATAAAEKRPAAERAPTAARDLSLKRFPVTDDGMERWRAKMNLW